METADYDQNMDSTEDGRKRRCRTNFTEAQSVFLEQTFQESHYPDQATKKILSDKLGIPEDRITVWFQNRRAKWRRKEQRERNIQNNQEKLYAKTYPTTDSMTSHYDYTPSVDTLYSNYCYSNNCYLDNDHKEQ